MATGPALDFFGGLFQILFYLIIPFGWVLTLITEYNRKTVDLMGYPDEAKQKTRTSNLWFLSIAFVGYMALVAYFSL